MVGVDKPDFLDLASRKLAWIDARTQVIAANIANADTPDFKARDVEPFTAFLATSARELRRTCATHLQEPDDILAATETPSSETSPDGNSVALDGQMRLLAETEQEQGVVTTLMKRYASMTTLALGVGG